jgi:NAD(P)-dependent dehydrogenase (short-subunit alcohol dehydrogenase family)
MRLENQVAIVTGGSVGIGRRIVEKFIAEGATVVIANRTAETGEATAEALDAHFVQTDISDPQSVQALVEATIEAYGRIDILVNNAAITGPQQRMGNYPVEAFDEVVRTNLYGPFYTMKYTLPHMEQAEYGVIINIVSTVGIIGFPHIIGYGAAKAGVVNMTKSVTAGYAHKGIRANAVSPSVVETPMLTGFIEGSDDPDARRAEFNMYNPQPGLVTTDAVADAVLFLAAEGVFTNGHTLYVDGGYVDVTRHLADRHMDE